MSSSTSIPYITIPACAIVEKSLTKIIILQSVERKKIGKMQGRISRRMLVLNPTIKQGHISLSTTFDYSSLHGMVMQKSLANYFTEKGDERKDGRTDEQM